MEYLLHALSVIVLLGLIIYDCILFTNSVESFGEEYKLADGAVGSVLAAIGTALPETIVPLVAVLGAVVTGTDVNTGENIALGAVLGSPFLLATVAFFVTGMSVVLCSWMKKRACTMCSNPIVLIRDLKFFVVSYTTAVLCAFIPVKSVKCVIALMLIFYYLWYVRRTLKKDFGTQICEAGKIELIFSKWSPVIRNKRLLIFLQITVSLAALILLAHLFVREIEYFSVVLNLHPMIMSLFLAPVATELPECINSALWIGSSKDTLSVSNITGALVFQSCIPVSIGILLTPWKFNEAAILSVILVYVSLGLVYINSVKNKGMLNPRILITCGLFYVIYVFYVLKMLI